LGISHNSQRKLTVFDSCFAYFFSLSFHIVAPRLKKFSKFDGWGHNFFDAGDEWEAIVRTGKRWDYHASHSDQGLLYFWAKYYVQDVSLVIGSRIDNWVSQERARSMADTASHVRFPSNRPDLPVKVGSVNETAILPHTAQRPLLYQYECDGTNRVHFVCGVPYRDYVHMTGKSKPWQKGVRPVKNAWALAATLPRFTGEAIPSLDAFALWVKVLYDLDREHNLKIDLESFEHMKESPLGYMAMFGDHHNRVHKFHNSTNATTASAATAAAARKARRKRRK
jgi:hypothetical protein